MKILLGYPPLESKKGIPLLSQNRQFQFFKEPTYIYPVVPAYAATLLKQAGHQVIWLDCIAESISYNKFIEIVKKEKPEVIAFETKTPVIKRYWKIIDDLKNLESFGFSLKTVIFGDHVSALPEESFRNSRVDYVLTGGDYDFLLLSLCNLLESLRGMRDEGRGTNRFEAGIYYRENGQIKNSGLFKLNHDLNTLPSIDRELTKWQNYAYKNGNFKRTPATYIMSGRDCWWGKCSFCSWPVLYPQYRLRSPENVLGEIASLINDYGVREIMDDTGTFPCAEWLADFCKGMIERGYNRSVYLDCNMRFGALSTKEYRLMKKANFRLLLFGLESANQKTLDRLNKGIKVEEVIDSCKAARRAGLFPHITLMFGYPWESYEEALATLKLGRWLLKKGYAYTMQATVTIPYPGSPLFEECSRLGLLESQDWDDYDMKKPVMKTLMPAEKIMELVQGMYKVSYSAEFILRKIFSIRDMDDLKYSLRAAKKVAGHLLDFKSKAQSR